MSVKQDDIQSMLRKLFLKYACDGSKLNMNYLRLGKFLQMMQDACCIVRFIQDGNLNNKQLELIFCSENKHRVNMTFETFLETIPRVVKEKYPKLFSQKPGDAFNKLLKDHFVPLCKALMKPGTNQDFEIDEVDNDCMLILHDAHNGLKELYSLLFPWEIRRNVEIDVLLNRSQRALHAFLRDFDICPTLINKNQVNRLWNSLILVQPKNCQIALELVPDDRLELGTCLTFSKFLLMLYHISLKGYEEDLNLGPSPPPEKLLVLLERMELSKGFQALSSRVAKFGLLPSRAVIHRVLYPETENIDEFSQESGNESELVDEVVDLDQSLGLQLSPMGLTKLEENIEKIQHIFQ
jgi:hypothetical protein